MEHPLTQRWDPRDPGPQLRPRFAGYQKAPLTRVLLGSRACGCDSSERGSSTSLQYGRRYFVESAGLPGLAPSSRSRPSQLLPQMGHEMKERRCSCLPCPSPHLQDSWKWLRVGVVASGSTQSAARGRLRSPRGVGGCDAGGLLARLPVLIGVLQ